MCSNSAHNDDSQEERRDDPSDTVEDDHRYSRSRTFPKDTIVPRITLSPIKRFRIHMYARHRIWRIVFAQSSHDKSGLAGIKHSVHRHVLEVIARIEGTAVSIDAVKDDGLRLAVDGQVDGSLGINGAGIVVRLAADEGYIAILETQDGLRGSEH